MSLTDHQRMKKQRGEARARRRKNNDRREAQKRSHERAVPYTRERRPDAIEEYRSEDRL